jgi:hypothetical protein
MQDHPKIYFWGPWTPTERNRVASAVQTFDHERGLGNTLPGESRPWVAVMHELPGSGRYCFASRIGIRSSFTGTSIPELCASIEDAATDHLSDD